MRAEWNERAREDANYYVAFGRREQDEAEFLSTAADVIRNLETELKRFPPNTPFAARRALEIGCGPGRLLLPMSRHFGEIHGVDVSDEMIAQAREKLRDVPHAHVHHSSGSDLSLFPSEHFDFVYSYAVFQHIPSAEVVFSYFREVVRVLRPGGFARLQINGLPKTAASLNTWEGVRVSGEEIRAFTREHGIRLLSLTGLDTQYMWTAWQKPPVCRIAHVSNGVLGEQPVPASGRFAEASLLVENLPDGCELNSLSVKADGAEGTVGAVGPLINGFSQIDFLLPQGVRTGLVPVALERGGQVLAEAWMRVVPAVPSAPLMIAISDGLNLMSYDRITSGLMKVTIENVKAIDTFSATVDGVAVGDVTVFETDPRASRYEVNFRLPKKARDGGHLLEVYVEGRLLTRMGIEVTANATTASALNARQSHVSKVAP